MRNNRFGVGKNRSFWVWRAAVPEVKRKEEIGSTNAGALPRQRKLMANGSAETKRYLVASDFDQTLSFNDSGLVLSELVGIHPTRT